MNSRSTQNQTFAVMLLFFLSGVASLIYQITWQRLLAFFGGMGHFSITVIVAAFMAGLGIGSLAAGYWVDRQSRRTAVISFAVCEFAIAIFGFISPWLLYRVLYIHLGYLASFRAVIPVTHFFVLLIPTFLMGASLPLLSRALVKSLPQASRVIGALYGINTVGAGTGGLLTVYLFFPTMGLQGTIYLAVVINVVIGVCVLLLSRKVPAHDRGEATLRDASPEADIAGDVKLKFPAWLYMAAMAGFLSLALEIVWLRILSVAVKMNPQTFGSILGLMLIFVGTGSLLGVLLVKRQRRPTVTYLWCQWAISFFAALPLMIILYGDPDSGILKRCIAYWSEGQLFGPGYEQLGFYMIHLGIPVFMISISSLFMGMSFPFLQKAVQTQRDCISWRVGAINSAIIAGNILGVLLTGTYLVVTVGTPGTFRFLIIGGAVFGLLAGLSANRFLIIKTASVAFISAGIVFAIPNQQEFWARFHGRNIQEVKTHEDQLGVAALREKPVHHEGDVQLVLLGRYMGSFPYSSAHIIIGAISVLVHPDPRDVLVIGFGSGATPWAAGSIKKVVCIDTYELMKAEHTLLDFKVQKRFAAVKDLLNDPRFSLIFEDGRLGIRTREKQYDVIELDTWEDREYGGSLYTREFFEEVKSRLKPGGYFCTIIDTPRLFRTAYSVFPHGVQIGFVSLLSNDPIPFDRKKILQLIRSGEVQNYFRKGDLSTAELERIVTRGQMRRFNPSLQELEKISPNLNTDLFPHDELRLRYPEF